LNIPELQLLLVLLAQEFTSSPFWKLQLQCHAAPYLRSTWRRTRIFVWLAPVNNFWVLPCWPDIT